ncbi:MAG: outer membrane beta-barrel protein [Bacteroidales bacterium]|nr:outer membrane beta-barrel protein [Bacteroidales bacterium]
MKRLLVFILLFSATIASAQVYIGGSVSGSYGNSQKTGVETWSFNVKPEIGYIMNDTWAFGGRVAYGKSVTKTEVPGLEETDTDTDINLLTINPYAAYSTLTLGDFAVWLEMGVQFIPKQKTIDYATMAWYLEPVLTYDLNRNILLKTNLNFARLAWIGTTEGSFVLAGNFGADNIIAFDEDFSIGFVYRY